MKLLRYLRQKISMNFENTNKPELESLVYELKIISKQEAVFGDNNKDEAIETINKMISKL